MNRCECHQVSFGRIAALARQEPGLSFDELRERIGFGWTCTACHCDAKCFLGRLGFCRAEACLVESADREAARAA